VEEKNTAALLRFGAKAILADFLNLPDRAPELAQERARNFTEKYGPLIVAEETTEMVLMLATAFRAAAHLDEGRDFYGRQRNPDLEQHAEAINKLLDLILGNVAMGIAAVAKIIPPKLLPELRPAIRTNFLAGTWEPVPRMLLDALAIELVRSWRQLRPCNRAECRRWFVKEFSRDRYCSMRCSELMRKQGQSKWAREHAEEISKRRRKSGKKRSKR